MVSLTTRNKTVEVSIVIPAYNEEKSVGEMLSGLIELYPDFEIIVIDDGSTDNTYNIIKGLSVKTIRHSFNKGYGASIKTGIRAASGNFIATMDADGQHDPKDILKLIEKIGGCDMVVGERGEGSHKPFWRQHGKKVISWAANSLSRTYIPDLNSGLRIFKKDIALKYIHLLPNGFSLSTTMTIAFLRDGYNIEYVPITVKKRSGKSTVNLFDGLRALLLVIRLITLFSPLRIFLPMSLIIFIPGVCLLIIDLFHTNIQDVTILTILTGLLIFFFGLIVDQMAHIRREIKQ